MLAMQQVTATKKALAEILQPTTSFRLLGYIASKNKNLQPHAAKLRLNKTRLKMRTAKVTTFLVLLLCLPQQATQAEKLTASWYSTASLKSEGTYKYSKGVMANGQKFNDNNLTCATNLYPLGARLLVRNLNNKKEVTVEVTDRIGKRFAQKRIDLSRLAFSRIAKLKRGIVAVSVKRIK